MRRAIALASAVTLAGLALCLTTLVPRFAGAGTLMITLVYTTADTSCVDRSMRAFAAARPGRYQYRPFGERAVRLAARRAVPIEVVWDSEDGKRPELVVQIQAEWDGAIDSSELEPDMRALIDDFAEQCGDAAPTIRGCGNTRSPLTCDEVRRELAGTGSRG